MAAPEPPASGDALRQHVTRMIEGIPPGLLDEPLDYILADHARKRAMCACLIEMARAREASRAIADGLAAYLSGELRLHHADEDDGLFPALRRRLTPEDDLGVVLTRLGDDHRRGATLIDAIVKALARGAAAEPVRLTAGDGRIFKDYASAEQQHLALENGVVMGIARIRLTRGDLRLLRDGMKARRGVVH